MKIPEIHESVFVAPTATVVGNVRICAESSVFFGAVIRSELDEIVIGRGTNIQDNCVLHIERGMPLHVGDGCTVGHSAILHSCTVGDNTLVRRGGQQLHYRRGSAGAPERRDPRWLAGGGNACQGTAGCHGGGNRRQSRQRRHVPGGGGGIQTAI